MAFKVTFNAVDKTSFIDQMNTPKLTRKQNERSTATLTIKPGYIPNKLDPCIIYDVDGTTPVFGGLVTNRQTRGIEPGNSKHWVDVSLVDWMIYTDWCYWTKDYGTGTVKTLKQILTDFISEKLSVYGITLDASQDNGPSFTSWSVKGGKGSDIIRSLCSACSPTRVSRMSPAKELRLLVPGTLTAPVTIVNGATNCRSFEWKDSSFTPANKVELVCGPASGDFTYEGTRVQSGSATSWQYDIPGRTDPGVVFVNGVARTISAFGAGGGGSYEWDHANYTLHIGLDGTPANGTTLVVQYWVDYPFSVFATSGASPVIEERVSDENILTVPTALAAVSEYLNRLNQANLREADVSTFVRGFEPSQSLTVNLSSRSVASATFGIGEVNAEFTEFRDRPGLTGTGQRLWLYTFHAQETLVYQGSYLDQIRNILSGGSGATPIAASGGTTPVTVLSSPVYMGGSSDILTTNPNGGTRGKLIRNAVPYIATDTFSARLRFNIRSRDAGVGAKVIFTDLTTDISSAVTTSTTFVDDFVNVSVLAGHTYWVYVQSNAAGDAGAGYAQLEAL